MAVDLLILKRPAAHLRKIQIPKLPALTRSVEGNLDRLTAAPRRLALVIIRQPPKETNRHYSRFLRKRLLVARLDTETASCPSLPAGFVYGRPFPILQCNSFPRMDGRLAVQLPFQPDREGTGKGDSNGQHPQRHKRR
jgi:hypothetical protein